VILPSTTCSLINIFADPGTTFQSANQMSSLGLQPGLGAFIHHLPLILGISYS